MRIVSVSIPYPGPGDCFKGIFVRRRLEAVARHVDLEVVSPRPWFPGLRPAPPVDQTGVSEVPPVSRPRMFYVPGVLKNLDGFWLNRVLMAEMGRRRGESLDLLDAQFEYPEGVGVVLAARVLGLPAFVTLRGLLTKYLKSCSRRGPCIAALQDAAGVISVAHSLKRTAEAHGVDGARIRVIPNAIDSRTFSPGPQAAARVALGIALDYPLIVTVGHLQPVKGQHDLIPALARVKARHGPVHLALIGDDHYDLSYSRRVRRQAAEMGLSGEVEFLGQQPPERVAAWLRAADLLALPSYHEGCCNAVLEALACGTPVVTTPVGDNTDYVGGSNGVLAPSGNIEALAAAIDEALVRTWDRPAIAAPMTAWTWDRVARETLDFYRERLENFPRPGFDVSGSMARPFKFSNGRRP